MENRQVLFDHPLFGEILPEYKYYPWIEEDLSNDKYFTTSYESLAKKEKIPKVYDKKLNFENFPPEYLLVVEKINGEILEEHNEIPFLFVYGNYHWNNILGFIFTLLNICDPFDEEFRRFADIYSIPNGDLIIFWEDLPELKEGDVYCVFNKLMNILQKDSCSFMSRYLYNYREEIISEGGLKIMMPTLYKVIHTSYPEIFNGINDIFIRTLNELECEDRNNNVKNFKIDYDTGYDKIYRYVPPKNEVTRIHAFRLVRDYSSDSSRFSKKSFPFGNGLLEYNPPIARNSKVIRQPYKYVYVNGKIGESDLDVRITATEHILTSMLDWCTLKNKEIPLLGSEFYIHLGDKLPKSILESKVQISCYSCEKKYLDRFDLFPDYTFQWMNGLTWEDSKLTKPHENITKSGIYFEGNSYSVNNIRTDMGFLQDKNIKRAPNLNGVLDIRLSEPYPEKKRNVYIHLPGSSSFNPMLKFIALKNYHLLIIKDQNYTENYFESKLKPFDFHTIDVKYPEEKDELIKKIGRFYRDRNKETYIKKSQSLKEKIRSLTIEDILEDVYNIVKKQNNYYGFK